MSEYYACPASENGKHSLSLGSTYFDHLGNDIGGTKAIPFASVTKPCTQCERQLLTLNLGYPNTYLWDNRRKEVSPKAKGGWTLYEGMHQIMYMIHEEPTFDERSVSVSA